MPKPEDVGVPLSNLLIPFGAQMEDINFFAVNLQSFNTLERSQQENLCKASKNLAKAALLALVAGNTEMRVKASVWYETIITTFIVCKLRLENRQINRAELTEEIKKKTQVLMSILKNEINKELALSKDINYIEFAEKVSSKLDFILG